MTHVFQFIDTLLMHLLPIDNFNTTQKYIYKIDMNLCRPRELLALNYYIKFSLSLSLSDLLKTFTSPE